MYALMLKPFHELREGKYYKIVDELDDGRSVIDVNTGKATESLLAVPPEYFVVYFARTGIFVHTTVMQLTTLANFALI